MNFENDYVALTEALAQECSELLLEHSGATSNLYKQSEESSRTVLEQFIFLRQFCYSQNIFSLFEAIKRNPDRLLNHEDVLKPLGYGIPSRKFYTNPFLYSRGLQKVSNIDGKTAYIPQQVYVTQKYDSLDTPANRFIKYALKRFDMICTELIGLKDTINQSECILEASAIHEMLEEMFNDSFFDEIGKLDIMPQNNQVLQKREGYAQIFSAYMMVDLALQLDWHGKDEVYEGESKNVALLYEYWLFFELYKIINSIAGCRQVYLGDKDFVSIDEDGLTISLREGEESRQAFIIDRLHIKINLYYNRTFSRKEFQTTLYEGSYSRPFRPDYTIAIYPDKYCKGRINGEEEAIKNGEVSYIHFDAKYRVSDITSLVGKDVDTMSEQELQNEKMDAVVNTYKRGDLLKMHTYNDAIRRTVGSYVLYPGSDVLPGEKSRFKLYDEILPGVGAFAIRPSIDKLGENELKNFIVSVLESKVAMNTRLNRLNHYTEMVLKEPALSALNDDKVSINNKVSSNVGESCVLGYIKDEKDGYYESLNINKLLSKGSEFLFYFYAISGANVYSHHQDVFKATDFCFYKNDIRQTNTYNIEPVLCKIESYELLSRSDLVARLNKQGYDTTVQKRNADFYYVLKVKVVNDMFEKRELDVSRVNSQNGNDTFSPHSPKVILWKEQEEISQCQNKEKQSK
jgi:predicted component of viral defense system (DUF524 family)